MLVEFACQPRFLPRERAKALRSLSDIHHLRGLRSRSGTHSGEVAIRIPPRAGTSKNKLPKQEGLQNYSVQRDPPLTLHNFSCLTELERVKHVNTNQY